MKNIFAIVGSAQQNSSNLKLVKFLSKHFSATLHIEVFDELSTLPHFDAVQTLEDTPAIIESIRKKIADADAVLISSPEYVFSIPAGLKNVLEWCVATTIFSGKPVAIIVASADGRRSFEEIKLIMKTLGATFNNETCVLINGVRGKVVTEDNIDADTQRQLVGVLQHLQELI
ncbi:MAG: NAD(P)H-dependent oxidoreductase [Chitinophagaceae bacterium]|nr:NAD(P)H-dependent oxidoreductase [Chitinophagaceae bacterium]